jgi:peptidoglycan/xylan/chitin deacetylase (PgdA/CDA1 family)
VALAGYLLPGLAGALPVLRAPLGVEDHTSSGRGYALTFDDGPHAQGTPAVLELLARAEVTATFFLVGEQIERNRTLAAEIVAAGHTIGLHCHRHRNLLRLTPRQVRGDIDRAEALIGEATGLAPALYRQTIAARLTDGVGEGAVLLLHDADDYSAPDSWQRTVQALPRVLATLEQRGLHPVAP